MENKIDIKIKKKVTLDDLDFKLRNDFFTEIEQNKLEEINEFHDYMGNVDYIEGSFINIDELITILNKFKEKDINYVAFDYNEDHYGYEIIGLKIERK